MFSTTLTSATPAAGDRQVTILATDPVAAVRTLKAGPGMGIWLCGCGRLAAHVLTEIDEIIIKRHPMAIGSGMSAFNVPYHPVGFTTAHTQTFASGVAVATYVRRPGGVR